jgi:hypothetical protein
MSSAVSTLGQGALAAGPAALAGVAAGRARGEDYRFRAGQAEATRAIQRESLNLKAILAEREAEYRDAMLDIKRKQQEIDEATKEALRVAREAQAGLSEERARDLRETRPGRIAGTEALAGQRGAQTERIKQEVSLINPLTADLLKARAQGLTGEEARRTAMHPYQVARTQAGTDLARAQAGTIRTDDERLAEGQRALIAYRNRLASVAESAEKRRARTDADRTGIMRIMADARMLSAKASAAQAQAATRRIEMEIRKLGGRFPEQFLQMLDRDIKVAFQKDYRGQLTQDPVSLAARERVAKMLQMMWGTIHVPVDLNQGEPGVGGEGKPVAPPVLRPADGSEDPDFWEGLLSGAGEALSGAGQVFQGAGPVLGGGGGLDPASPIMQAIGTMNQAGERAPSIAAPFPKAGAPPPAPQGSPAFQNPYPQMTPPQIEALIAFARSQGNKKDLATGLAMWRDKTGKEYRLRTYQNRPQGLSDGDIDYARVLLSGNDFDNVGHQFAALGDWETVSDLIAAWRYLNRPPAARVQELKRRWGVPEVLSPRLPARR